MKPPVAKSAAAAPPTIDYAAYAYGGAYDRSKIRAGYLANFSQVQFTASTLTDLEQLLGFMESDAAITDLRWVAYMLATVMWEAKVIEAVLRVVKDKKGNVLLDKAKIPKTRSGTAWHSMSPKSEDKFGKGRAYYEPVKVDVQSADKIIITEQDGDQWQVTTAGTRRPVSKNPTQGSPFGGIVSEKYKKAKGTEHSFYGRGYTQLTWWENYLTAGVMLNLGSYFLVNPEATNNPKTAYDIMSTGMITGKSFAGGNKFSKYFTPGSTDYVGARFMVSSRDLEPTIVTYAKKFESILLASKVEKQ